MSICNKEQKKVEGKPREEKENGELVKKYKLRMIRELINMIKRVPSKRNIN